MSELKLTQNQIDAICHGEGSALVSASAGSGKTFVVIERIIRLINENKTSVLRTLAVTFTKLAAAEMKDKLKTALTEKYLETRDRRYKLELELLPYADISTVHSFCAKLLRKYFYVLGIDADFKVIEETEKIKVFESAMELLFNRLYEEKSPEFLDLVSVFGSHRNDEGLKSTVKSLYYFSESESGIHDLAKKTLTTYQNTCELLIEEYASELKTVASDYLSSFTSLIGEFEDDLPRKTLLDKALTYAKDLLSETDYFNYFANYVKNPLKLVSTKSKNLEASIELKALIEGFRESISDACEVFSVSKETKILQSESGIDRVKALLELTKKFSAEYSKLKQEENVVDFSDLERYTLKLLKNEEILTEVRSNYDYAFIDEYQDVNGVQEEILSLVSKDKAFLVGDAKQSIYAFRGCNPEYFINKYFAYKEGKGGRAISLDNNFRSAPAVVNAVNDIFNKIMTKSFGGNDYSLNPMIYGGGYGGFNGSSKIHVIEKKPKEEVESGVRGVYSVKNASKKAFDSELSSESKLILKIISDSLNTPYYDIKEKDQEKRLKPIGFKDICILVRSMKGLGEELAEALQKSGIPVTAETEKNVSNYPEIKVAVNLLALLVCAERDVPLATVMLSLFGFTESELQEIRKRGGLSRKTSFTACVKAVAKEGDNLGNKTAKFLAWLDKNRLIAEFSSVGEVISRAVKETGYYAKIMASEFGGLRVKRLERFIAECSVGGRKMRATEFEEHVQKTLDKIAVSEATTGDAVKIMTMHKSKGLEFPLVIVAGTSKRFSDESAKGPIITERNYGLAIKSYDFEKMTATENGVRELLKHKIKRTSQVEELRLFYVALTRAKCHLHVVVDGAQIAKETRPFYSISKMSDFLSEGETPIINYLPRELGEGLSGEKQLIAGKVVSAELTKLIEKNLNFVYPYKEEISLPIKRSVSDVNKGDSDEYFKTSKQFGDTSAEKGTAYHRVLELIDFYNFKGASDIEKLVNDGLLTPEQAKLVDSEKIKKILQMKVFDDIKGTKIYKERKFCQLVPASELAISTSNEEVLIQGVIDLISIDNDGAVLIDYKLSSIEKDEDLKKSYEKQMFLYKNAIEKILKLKVKKVYLINVLQERAVEV